jgi:hypothetical protein
MNALQASRCQTYHTAAMRLMLVLVPALCRGLSKLSSNGTQCVAWVRGVVGWHTQRFGWHTLTLACHRMHTLSARYDGVMRHCLIAAAGGGFLVAMAGIQIVIQPTPWYSAQTVM